MEFGPRVRFSSGVLGGARIEAKRRLARVLFQVGGGLALTLALGTLGLLVFNLVKGAWPAFRWSVLTTTTQGTGGGLANALLGTLWLGLLTTAIATPVGVATATWMTVWGRRHAQGILLASDILAGVPSIVFGYVGYLAFVLALGWGFSALAAAFTLGMLVLPYVIRNVAQALQQVPYQLWESAMALGFTRIRAIWHILWPQAGPGILTGVVLASGIAMGETAPLLYTAEWSQNLPSLALTHHAVGYLTYVVWAFIQEPYPSAVALAYMAGLLLMLMVGSLALWGRLRVTVPRGRGGFSLPRR